MVDEGSTNCFEFCSCSQKLSFSMILSILNFKFESFLNFWDHNGLFLGSGLVYKLFWCLLVGLANDGCSFFVERFWFNLVNRFKQYHTEICYQGMELRLLGNPNPKRLLLRNMVWTTVTTERLRDVLE